MRFLKQIFIVLLFAFLLLWGFENGSVMAQRSPQEIQQEIQELEQELGRLKLQANTLSSQIAQFNAQIRLAELSIAKTEERILLLGGRIDQLEGSLSALTNAFSSRVSETYKMGRVSDAFIFLISAPDLNQAVIRFHYLQRIQEADRSLLVRLQEAQTVYVGERTDQEELQEELEGQRQVLGVQKAAKADLLSTTKNDERKYQQLLAQARAEYEAILGILAGKGKEVEIGKVSQGQRIASIIQGPSCNSSGEHTHFIVSENGTAYNPFDYLKSTDHQNCSGPGLCSPGDPFNPTGSWDWPISPSIKFTQGYGSTWAVQNTWVGKIYNFHNGIDINSSDFTVRAVQGGTLYNGAYSGSGGCALKYVRVNHDNSNLDTFYLHINY